MTQIHKVSVIVSIYNIENYILECIESILQQSYTNLEVICVNDASTDNSLKILKSLAKKDDRILLINQKNQGLSVTRNTGIANATGKYIYFIDGDDFISTDYIETMVNTIVQEKTKAVHNPNYTEYFDKYSPKNKHINKHQSDAFETNDITHSTWSKLFDLQFLKETKLTFMPGLLHQDYEFWNKFIAHLDKLSFCHSGMYYYRQRDNSITYNAKNQKAYKNHILICIDSIYSYYAENKNTLHFKPLYINLLEDHLYYQNKKYRLKFILEARTILNKFDDFYIQNIIHTNIRMYKRFTINHKLIKLIYKAYISKY